MAHATSTHNTNNTNLQIKLKLYKRDNIVWTAEPKRSSSAKYRTTSARHWFSTEPTPTHYLSQCHLLLFIRILSVIFLNLISLIRSFQTNSLFLFELVGKKISAYPDCIVKQDLNVILWAATTRVHLWFTMSLACSRVMLLRNLWKEVIFAEKSMADMDAGI